MLTSNPPLSLSRSDPTKLLILLTASAGCAMTVLDANIVAVILPAIARGFGASFADIEWVISAYVLCFASMLLPAGSIADRFGRRRLFLAGILGFAIASLLCGVASSATGLYLARTAQGIGAAFMLAPALAIIAHSFHQPADRDRAWGLWGGIMGLTMVLAPILGGVLAEMLGWRWAFFINLPVCAALALAASQIPESKGDGARRLDPVGIMLFATTMFSLTWGLIQGQAHGWMTIRSTGGFAIGSVSALGFFVAERRQREPMIDLSLFRAPRLLGAVWAMFAYASCAQVMTSLLPAFLQNGRGLTALLAGFAMLPFALAMLAFPYVGRRLAGKITSFDLLVLGLAVVGLGDGVTALGAWSGRADLLIVGMFILGSGGGLLNGETQKAIMNNLPLGRAGIASGISTTARFSGILLGFALLSGILGSVTRLVIDPAGGIGDAVAAGNIDAVVVGLSAPAADAAIEMARHAYATGFAAAMVVAGVLSWGSALLVHYLARRNEQIS